MKHNDILLTPFQLQKLLVDASELGAILALTKIGNIKPYLKKSEAFKKYGRRNVENWILGGQVTPRKDGNHSAAWRIDRIEIETVHKAKLAMNFL